MFICETTRAREIFLATSDERDRAKLRRMQFGRKSEKLERQIEQLELRLEALQMNDAETVAALPKPMASVEGMARPARRPLPTHLPREVRTHLPKQEACPECGGALRKLGEDVSEVLERIPARFYVIRHVRVNLACASCDKIVQAEAPSRPIERGMAGPGLLAHVLVSKYGDHLPSYRQSEIYAREGVELDRATLAGWVGQTSRLLEPLVEVLRRHVMSAGKLHADDIPVPVLAPGLGKTKIGRLWTYMRDDRPSGDATPPAVWFAYTPDRKGEHPKAHLEKFTGTLQADGYAGFDQIYEAGKIQEAACWAHVRRKFYDIQVAHKSAVATEALERIGALYAIETEIRGRSPEERRAVRNDFGTPQNRAFPQLNLHSARARRNHGQPRPNSFTGRAQNSPPAFTSQGQRASGKALTLIRHLGHTRRPGTSSIASRAFPELDSIVTARLVPIPGAGAAHQRAQSS